MNASLTAADWHRLNRLLEQGLELAGDARSDWLGGLPDEDRHLCPTLMELLSHSDATGFATAGTPPTTVARMASAAIAAMRRDAAGDRIGPWQLERLLAEGGMGAVWIAQRADGVMQRTAALKLPRAEWVDRGLAERIARERAILARLQHAHIAVLYDAGLADGGRPYLALEYVDGQPIDAWCGSHDLRTIVGLVAKVARAVAYAHGQLVIHRDLKPANVLVGADGSPKLLDFGISKLIEGDTTSSVDATALTRMAGRPLTLAYAAPEQVLGMPVGVTADVYALGVMLFELLAGARLYQATAPHPLEAEILKGDLRRPSDVAADEARARALRGDLDAIVATALKRTPAQRYDSAAALADDLERYLAGKPVRARPDSAGYRLSKFLARNAVLAAAATAIVVALGVGLGVALWQGNKAREQAARATALNAFVLGLIRTADPNASRATNAADVAMLRSIEARIDHDFGGSPGQLLQLRVTVGDAYRNRGEMSAAQRVFQKAADEAQRQLPADDLMLLTAQVRASDPELIVSTAAGAQLGQAISTLRAMARRDTAAQDLLIEALMIRIYLAQEFGVPAYLDHDETTRSVDEVESIAVERFGPGSRQHLRAARVVADLAGLRHGEEKVASVVTSALDQARARGGDVLESPEFLALRIVDAGMECARGNVTAGLSTLWDLVNSARAGHGPHNVLLERLYEWIAVCMTEIADPTAVSWHFEAYDVAAARERPPSTNLMRRALQAFNAALGARDFDAAERFYQSALDNARAVPEDAIRQRLTQNLRNGRVCHLMLRGDAEAAVAAAMPQLEYYDRVYAEIGRLTPAQGGVWVCAADALRQLGRWDEAIRIADTFARRCRELVRVAPTANCAPRAESVRALTELDAGRIDDAAATLRAHLDRPLADARDGRMLKARVRLLLVRGNADEAAELMRREYGYWLSVQPGSPYAAESLYWLGRASQAAGDRRGTWMIEQARSQLAASPIAIHRRLASGPHRP